MDKAHITSTVFRRCHYLKLFKTALKLITTCLLIPGILGCRSILEHFKKEPAAVQEGQIAFVSEKDGNFDIYTMSIDGSEKNRLTEHEAADFDPAWSPDGKQIAFVSLRDGVGKVEWSSSCSDDNCEIYAVDANGSNLRRLTYSEDLSESNPVWSPDGNYIAFVTQSFHERDSVLSIMNSVGSDLLQLTKPGSYVYDPAWSTDGRWIAYKSLGHGIEYEIYLMDEDGGSIVKLATGSDVSWSPVIR